MSKIAQYLNEHLLGHVSGLGTLREQYSSDAGVLEVTPELVVYPKATNDIRKVARFSWQLAEKGHVLSLTPRGFGNDVTGGAIGSGLLIDTSRYLNSILYVAIKDKDKIAHVQPGVSLKTLHETLRWNGLTIGAYTPDMQDMTVGGAIASGVSTYRSGKYGTIADAIDRMEVVLANGDLMEIGRVSKRDLSKKQGEQTLEGEIYRQIDAILEENAELIASLSSDADNTGYRIDQVQQKDGSFDLTPLFIGSQGTLGLISEVVLRTDFYNEEEAAMAIVCNTFSEARDVADILEKIEPTTLLSIDSSYYEMAQAHGKSYLFNEKDEDFSTVVYVSFDDFSDKARERKIKKALKALSKKEVAIYTSLDSRIEDLYAIRDVAQIAMTPLRIDETYAPVCDGAHIPTVRLSEFATEVTALAEKYHTVLPLSIDMLTGVVSTRALLRLKKVSDKQKVFKLSAEYAALVHKMGGSVTGGQAEGRLGAFAEYPQLDEAVVELNNKIRKVFDPYGTLNPGVKQQADLKSLIRLLKDN